FQQADWDQAKIEGMYQSFFAGYAASARKDFSIRSRLCEAVELLKCAVRRVPLFENDWASPSIRDAQSFSKSGTRRTAHLSNSTASHRRERKDFSIRSRLCEAVELLKCAVRRVPLFENDWASRIEGVVDCAEAAIDDVQRTLVLRTRRFLVPRSFAVSSRVKSRYLH